MNYMPPKPPIEHIYQIGSIRRGPHDDIVLKNEKWQILIEPLNEYIFTVYDESIWESEDEMRQITSELFNIKTKLIKLFDLQEIKKMKYHEDLSNRIFLAEMDLDDDVNEVDDLSEDEMPRYGD